MAGLSDLLVGKAESTKQGGTQQQFQRTTTPPQQQQLADLLNRAMVGQLARPPDTAISTPMQQAVTSYQQMMPGLQQAASGSLAARLSGPAPGSGLPGMPGAGVTGTGTGGASQDWTPAAGADQAGLQTRAQLGLPERSSYFTFMPSAQQVADIGLAPVRPGGSAEVQKAFQATQKIKAQQAAKAARQATPPGPGRKTAVQQAKIKARQGPSYL